MDAVEMQLALGHAPGLTAQQLRRALAAIEGAQASSAGLQGLFGQCRSSLESLGLAAATLQAADAARIAADRRWVESERVSLVDAAGAYYPPLLAQAEGAPALLYVKGNVACLSFAQRAMVGPASPRNPASAPHVHSPAIYQRPERPWQYWPLASMRSIRASIEASRRASPPGAHW